MPWYVDVEDGDIYIVQTFCCLDCKGFFSKIDIHYIKDQFSK